MRWLGLERKMLPIFSHTHKKLLYCAGTECEEWKKASKSFDKPERSCACPRPEMDLTCSFIFSSIHPSRSSLSVRLSALNKPVWSPIHSHSSLAPRYSQPIREQLAGILGMLVSDLCSWTLTLALPIAMATKYDRFPHSWQYSTPGFFNLSCLHTTYPHQSFSFPSNRSIFCLSAPLIKLSDLLSRMTELFPLLWRNGSVWYRSTQKCNVCVP